MIPPVDFIWSELEVIREGGEIVRIKAMVPLARFDNVVGRLEIGLRYRMEVIEERSYRSHKHYFAALNEAWKNLPEDVAKNYPTMNSLRSRLLIKAKHCHTTYKEFDTPQIAAKVAAFLKPMNEDDWVEAKGCVVRHSRAKSQSYSEMDKEEFNASKRDVLALLDKLLGTPQGAVAKNAGRSA